MNSTRESSPNYAFWLGLTFILGLLVWLLSGMLLPFVLGLAIAYFLEPVVMRMHVAGAPRWLCATIVLGIFLLVVTVVSMIVLPPLRDQMAELATAMPGYIDTVQDYLSRRIKLLSQQYAFITPDKLRTGVGQHTGEVVGFAGRVLSGVLVGGLALLDLLALFLLTPVIAFYFMRDWPKITAAIDGLMPLTHAATIKQELRNIDQMISGYLRGQAIVSMCLAAIYSVGLTLIGVKYGMIIGIAGGLLSFIPYVGTFTVSICSILVALIQFNSIEAVLPVAVLLIFAQILEGYFLTPRFVGDSVGLHPVWIMFAILAGGKLFGFTGVLLGVPILGVIAILLRVGIAQYRKSRLYYCPPDPPQQG